MKKLQETQLTSRTVSVWTFLHTLEAIFHAKISRSQHDAHELTQLINETLENENLRVHKILKRAKYEERDDINVAVREQLNALEIPEFPLSGLTVTRMDCLSCKHTSQPSFVPFLMLTLNTPEKSSTDLETILDENESETIEGYQCLKCRISKILQNEEYLKRDVNDPEEMEFIQQIVQLNSRPQLYINEDIPEELENYIKSYNVGGLDIATVSSNVLRKNQILKPPKIFGIHLSRSSFDGINITRNACRVAFKDHLTLSIGKDYTDKLQQFQDNEREVEQISDRMKKVLTTDVNDMEDEDVQREDIDEKGEDDEDETTGSSATETETETEGENSTEKEDEDDDLDVDSDTSSLTSQESAGAESISTTATLKAGSSNTGEALIFSAQGLQSLQTRATEYSSITKNQSDNLKRHFKSFKFNENDIYKYKLKALIRHQGSHSQGHYECYKRKPLYVKGKDGTIFKLSPEISDETIGDMSYHVSVVDEAGMSNSSSETDAEELKNGGQFRRRFSTMMGARRPSIVQSHQEDANIHEIINSGAQTPAELLIDNPEQDYFGNFEDPFKKSGKEEVKKPEKKKVKMTKIPSLIKNPYWRISDAQVVEVSRNSVLFETTTVYMLYYERVDRKQIKR